MGSRIDGDGTTGRLVASAALYWVLLISFLFSYILSGSSISLVLTADRVIDATGMSIALASQRIVKIPPTSRLTYGYHRFESLASVAMVSAFMLLLVYSGYASYENLHLTVLPDPVPTIYASIISLAVLPIISLLLHGNENVTAVTMSIHTLQDLITTASALVASAILFLYPNGVVGFAFSAGIIAVSIFLNRKIMTRNIRLLMEGTELDAEAIEEGLRLKFPMVHHIHIWDVCLHYRVATVHGFHLQ